MVHVVCVAGARPNFMKVKPVIDALERAGARVSLVHTGQHYDASMSDVFFEELGIRSPDVHLGVGSGSHAEQTARIMIGFEPVVERLQPDWVLVPGDVNSTLACALVAAKCGAMVGHIEAGLRSRDWAMPEEVNRVVADRVSDLLFAPSADAVENLTAEGYRPDQIVLAGNVMIDTLFANLQRAAARPFLAENDLVSGEYGVVTLHRPANVDDDAMLRQLLRALDEIAEQCPLVLPAHPRAAAQLRNVGVSEQIRLIPPAGYLDFVALQMGARIVLTDSGGVQEETTALGVPCVTLRDNTERPITVSEGTNTLAGRDPRKIIEIARRTLADPPPARRPALWDGHASDRIADAILERSSIARPPRPTDIVITER